MGRFVAVILALLGIIQISSTQSLETSNNDRTTNDSFGLVSMVANISKNKPLLEYDALISAQNHVYHPKTNNHTGK